MLNGNIFFSGDIYNSTGSGTVAYGGTATLRLSGNNTCTRKKRILIRAKSHSTVITVRVNGNNFRWERCDDGNGGNAFDNHDWINSQ